MSQDLYTPGMSHFHFNIDRIAYSYALTVQQTLQRKFVFAHSFGILGDIAVQFASVQQSLSPRIQHPHLLIFAGDHGVSGLSSISTYLQVLQLIEGKLPVNKICQVHNLPLQIIDAGVNHRFAKQVPIIHAKIGMGTQNILVQPAMTIKHGQKALEKGAKHINALHEQGCNLVGFGDLGTNNYLSASAIAAFLCNLPLDEFVPHELSNEEFLSLSGHIFSPIKGRNSLNTPLKLLTAFGGYELVQMVGAMLQAAEKKMVLLIDGFVSTVALLVAHWATPEILDYCIFCCETTEYGHTKLLNHLNVSPILTNWPTISTGTAIATVYPLLISALTLLRSD